MHTHVRRLVNVTYRDIVSKRANLVNLQYSPNSAQYSPNVPSMDLTAPSTILARLGEKKATVLGSWI